MTYICCVRYAGAVVGENGDKSVHQQVAERLQRDPTTGRFMNGNTVPHPNAGRNPEEWTWRALIRQRLSADPAAQAALIDALFAKGREGDVRALETIFNRCDGLLTQPIGGDLTRPLAIIIQSAIPRPHDDVDAGT